MKFHFAAVFSTLLIANTMAAPLSQGINFFTIFECAQFPDGHFPDKPFNLHPFTKDEEMMKRAVTGAKEVFADPKVTDLRQRAAPAADDLHASKSSMEEIKKAVKKRDAKEAFADSKVTDLRQRAAPAADDLHASKSSIKEIKKAVKKRDSITLEEI
ncbi:8928_t:CDS:2 [Cetraspora pellucida]|uniref:8928_t:CDS:1 n=1 Tax=Cetraspora pellucida TaxID=1433469 RepID=A0ACA9KTA8_9GLOM|nr:8928_t:CDS:2 [Cetraspora pellucida]